MLFEKQGLQVIPIPVDYSVVEDDSVDESTLDVVLGLLPSVGNLATTTNVMKEYIGIWIYSLQGWL